MRIVNKKLIFSLTVLLFAFLGILGVNYNLKVQQTSKNNTPKVILIDPGHGGMDGGAVSSRGTIEKHITLPISKYTKENLEKSGFKVYMTREQDKGLYENKGTVRNKKNQDLTARCKMKKELNCDIFVSVHLNKFPQEKYKGAQVWYSKHPKSKELAHILQTNLKNDLDKSNNRVEKGAEDQFKVLRVNDDMPSVIVECGFISNYEEEKLLKTEEYQKKVAQSICKSINEYFKNN